MSEASTAFEAIVPQPETINFIGDSQSRLFNGMLFSGGYASRTMVLAQTRWRPYFRAETFFGSGRFDEQVTRMLWELKCIVRTREAPDPIFSTFSFSVFGNATEDMQFRVSDARPVLIVSCGGVDVWDIEQELFPESWFELEDPPEGLERLRPYRAGRRLEYHEVYAHIECRMAPVFAGLRALRDAGLTNLFLHGMPPPSLEESGAWKPALLRYSTRITLNRIFERFCEAERIGFVPVWDLLSRDGLRDPRYFEDFEHYSPAAAGPLMGRYYAVTHGGHLG